MVETKHSRVVIDPQVMAGQPCTRGTRIPVALILEKLASGMTYEEILADHSRLTRDGILVAIAFAHDYLTRQDIILVASEDL